MCNQSINQSINQSNFTTKLLYIAYNFCCDHKEAMSIYHIIWYQLMQIAKAPNSYLRKSEHNVTDIPVWVIDTPVTSHNHKIHIPLWLLNAYNINRCGAGRWKRIVPKKRYTDLINQAVPKFRIGLQPVSWAVAFGLLVDDCIDIFHWMLFLE